MDAGKLDVRIWLLKPEKAQDAYGAEVNTHVRHALVWANRKYENAGATEQKEGERGSVLAAMSIVSWAIRWRADVTARWLVEDPATGEKYDIEQVRQSNERKQYLYLKTRVRDEGDDEAIG